MDYPVSNNSRSSGLLAELAALLRPLRRGERAVDTDQEKALELDCIRAALWQNVARTYLERGNLLPAALGHAGFDILIALDIAHFDQRRLALPEVIARAALDKDLARETLHALEDAGLVDCLVDTENPRRGLFYLSPRGLEMTQRFYRRFFDALEADIVN